jgi:hypothetical protein
MTLFDVEKKKEYWQNYYVHILRKATDWIPQKLFSTQIKRQERGWTLKRWRDQFD